MLFADDIGSAPKGTTVTDAAAQRMSRSHAGLLAGVFDEVDVGLVSVNPDSDFAHVNRTAAALVNMPVGDATVAAFNGAIANLAQRALNQGEVAEWLGSLERDPTAEFKSLWVFADYPTHLGVVSKPAPYPGFDGRIWAFYDNSPLARAVKASDHANARLRASADTMLDPQVLLEAVVEDGRIADLVTRDANNATCDYLGLHKAELIGRSVRQTMPIMARSGMLAQFIHCADGGDPVILDGVAFDSGIPGGLRYYDIRASRAEPGWISVTWRDVTERSELAQRIAESEEHFRLLAEDVGDVVVRLDEDGMMTWISNSIEHVLGATADHALAAPQRRQLRLSLDRRRPPHRFPGPALALAPGTAPPVELATDSIPVGILKETKYDDRSYTVRPAAAILVFGYGAFELALADGQRWSLAQFIDLFARTAARPGWTLDELTGALQDRSASGLFEDDCTLVRLHIP